MSAVKLAESKYFDPCILLTILANCATMAWESPLDPQGTRKADFISVCEWIFLAIFTIEMLVKILACGFIFHRHAYVSGSGSRTTASYNARLCSQHAPFERLRALPKHDGILCCLAAA